MPIRPAHEVPFSPPARCPKCGVGILPYGRNEPIVVDNAGKPYCRQHGALIEPTYAGKLAVYQNNLRRRQLEAIHKVQRKIA